jgi:hypothetical protein
MSCKCLREVAFLLTLTSIVGVNNTFLQQQQSPACFFSLIYPLFLLPDKMFFFSSEALILRLCKYFPVAKDEERKLFGSKAQM